MRVISGKFKGRKFDPRRLKSTRPTTDFAREGLFNVLTNNYETDGVQVLDLFSGSGAIAIEFVSRGAQNVICVDRDAAAVKFLATTCREWEIPEIQIFKSDVLKFVKKCKGTFDFIFADPPYDADVFEALWLSIRERHLLKENGLFIFEHDQRHAPDEVAGFVEKRTFGHVNFSIFSNC